MAAPRTAKLAGTVSWSDSSLFDGFALIGVAKPTVSSVAYASIAQDGSAPSQQLPEWTKVAIKAGAYDQNVKLFFSADIEPPNCRYAAYFYDINGVRVAPAGAASLFEITADPHTLTAPTLTVPVVSVSAPQPE